MQASRIALVGVAALALAGISASACPYDKSAKVQSYVPADLGGNAIRKVMRGDRMAVACDGIDLANSDVRVVLNFSAEGARALGYQGVLATDQTNEAGRVQIRVPDAPDLANHTLNVKVFVLNGATTTMCDAGKVLVG